MLHVVPGTLGWGKADDIMGTRATEAQGCCYVCLFWLWLFFAG